jgi:RNA polymerase sigma factor (sigma-70 family)
MSLLLNLTFHKQEAVVSLQRETILRTIATDLGDPHRPDNAIYLLEQRLWRINQHRCTREDAEDSAQEAVYRLLKSLNAGKKIPNPTGFAITTGTRIILTVKRRRDTVRKHQEPVGRLKSQGLPTPVTELGRRELSHLVENALTGLPEREQDIMLLHLEQWPASQIARKYNVHKGTVFVWLRNVRQRLRMILKAYL